MKITKQYLKQLIREQIKEQQNAAEAGEDAFDKALDQTSTADLDKAKETQADLNPQELKKNILDAARDVSGIMRNEMDIVNFALAILDAAKDKNLNSGVLRSKLELVKDEMARIK